MLLKVYHRFLCVDPIHILPNYFLRNSFNIFLPSTPTISQSYFSSGFQTKFLHTHFRRKRRWAECVVLMGEKRGAYRFLIDKN